LDLFLFVLALEVPAIVALLDCTNRDPDEFAGGEQDRREWQRWLWLGVLTAWFLVGNAVVLAYYFVVVKGSGRS
jgi:hypothetical protein